MCECDLSDLLSRWPHEAGRVNARTIRGRDGRDKLQVRIDLGVLQMELDGRPDGADSLLDHQTRRLEHFARQTGLPETFVLSSDECRALREEAVQIYHRYVALFAIGDYGRVVRDTQHNLALLDLCRAHGETAMDRHVLEQFRPAVVAMRARAEAEQAVAERQPRRALERLDAGLEELRLVYAEADDAEAYDNANEVQLLRGMRDALVPKLPASERVELQERLQAAIDAENYELAAILRDELRLMGP